MKRNALTAAALALLAGAVLAVALSPATAHASTISNKTFSTYSVPAGAHDRVYDHVNFRGGNSSTAVLTINHAARNITFTHCTIESGSYNGVTINATNGNIHDITFTHCRIQAAGHMGIECTQRPASNTVGYRNIKVIDTVIEPSGEEAMSFDGGYFAAHAVISGVTIMGSDNKANPAYSGAIEINGPTYFTVENTKIYACRKNALNLEGPSGNGHLVFRKVTIDYAVRHESYATDSSTARLTELQSVNGSVFTGCRFILGKAYNAGWWTDSSNNNLAKSAISGSLPSGRGMWSPDGACANNKMPVRK
jgi:hypothetical protein